MKTKLIIFLLVFIAVSCRPKELRITCTLNITYIDGRRESMPFRAHHFGYTNQSTIRLYEGCIRYRDSENIVWPHGEDVVCGVSKFTVSNYKETEL